MCIIREFRTAIAMIAAVGLISGAAGIGQAAPVSIDEFSSPSDSISDSTDNNSIAASQAPSSGSPADSDPLGGFRDLTVNMLQKNDPGDEAKASVNPNNSTPSTRLRISQDEGVRSYVGVQWDGDEMSGTETVNTTGLGGLDIVDGANSRIRVSVVANDASAANLTFNAWNSDGSGAFSLMKSIPTVDPDVDAPQVMEFAFSDFSGSPSFDDLGALSAFFNGDNAIMGGSFAGETPLPSGADIQIGSVESVPTPSAFAGGLLLLGGLACGRYRRRSAA